MEDFDNQKEDGSVWTSNSDLFMTIAIVFLILFIFSMIASGVQKVQMSIEKKQNEEYLAGKVPKPIKEKNKKDFKKLENELEQLLQKEKELETLAKSVSSIKDNINEKKKLFKDLKTDHLEKEARLLYASSTIEFLESSKKNLEEKLNNKNQKIDHLTKINNEIKKNNIEKNSKNEDLVKEQKILAQEMKIEKTKFNVMSKELESLKKNLKKSNEKLADVSDKLIKSNSKLKVKKEITNHKEEVIATLNSKLKKITEEKDFLSKDYRKNTLQNKKLQEELKNTLIQQKNLTADNLSQKKEMIKRDSKIMDLSEKLKKSTKNENTTKMQVKNLENALAEETSSSKAIEDNNKELVTSFKDLKNKYQLAKVKSDSYKKGMQNKEEENRSLSGILKSLEFENQKLNTKNSKISALNDSLTNKNQTQDVSLSRLDKNMKECITNLDQKTKDLEHSNRNVQKLDKISKNVGKQLTELTKKLSFKNGKLSKLNSSLKKSKKKNNKLSNNLNRVLTEKKNISNKIYNRIKDSGIDIDIDEESGIITIKMDEAFQFKRSSFELNDFAKENLGKIIPVYAKSLFEEESIKKRIASVLVTGHASPSYGGKFIDPEDGNEKAYQYNLELSLKRAEQIAHFIFGGDIGNYTFKNHLKKITKIAGKGYMEPLNSPSLNSNYSEKCGVYDCKKSRRVEISFILKDISPGKKTKNSNSALSH